MINKFGKPKVWLLVFLVTLGIKLPTVYHSKALHSGWGVFRLVFNVQGYDSSFTYSAFVFFYKSINFTRQNNQIFIRSSIQASNQMNHNFIKIYWNFLSLITLFLFQITSKPSQIQADLFCPRETTFTMNPNGWHPIARGHPSQNPSLSLKRKTLKRLIIIWIKIWKCFVIMKSFIRG